MSARVVEDVWRRESPHVLAAAGNVRRPVSAVESYRRYLDARMRLDSNRAGYRTEP